MLVNLTDVLTTENKAREQAVPIEADCFESRMGTYPIIEKTPVDFCFTNYGVGKVRIEGSAEVVLSMNCDRCLKEVQVQIPLAFTREVQVPVVTDSDSEDDNQDFMEGYQLNAEKLIYNEMLINRPLKVLCREDCKGICMQCGKDLNEGKCQCDTFVPDPRMAAIKDIFNANKEV